MFTCDVRKERSFAHTSLTVNYCSFTHFKVSYRFNEKTITSCLNYHFKHVLISRVKYLS